MAVRSDIVLRSEKYTETGNRYNWRWEWIDSDVDFTDAKKKKLLNPKYPDKVRLGQWIRKIRSSGKAYCTLCQKEVNYANKGCFADITHMEFHLILKNCALSIFRILIYMYELAVPWRIKVKT